jgi:hypothetical protein
MVLTVSLFSSLSLAIVVALGLAVMSFGHPLSGSLLRFQLSRQLNFKSQTNTTTAAQKPPSLKAHEILLTEEVNSSSD